MNLAGLWDFRIGDDLAWAQWPADLDEPAAFNSRNALPPRSGTIRQPVDNAPLAGTQSLTVGGDIASQLVTGVDKFLLREIDRSVEGRARFWHRDFSSLEAYSLSIETNRQRLTHILGARDARVSPPEMELLATLDQPALVGQGANYEIRSVRWPAFGNVHGEGSALTPTGKSPVADVIAIPDAGQTPNKFAACKRESQSNRNMRAAWRERVSRADSDGH